MHTVSRAHPLPCSLNRISRHSRPSMGIRRVLVHHPALASILHVSRLRLEVVQTICPTRAVSYCSRDSEVCYLLTGYFEPMLTTRHRLNLPDYRPRKTQFSQAIKKIRALQRTRRNRGFAFSQTEESQEKIIRSYDTTQQKSSGL